MTKRIILAANWKMNKLYSEAIDFINVLNNINSNVKIIVSSPYLYLNDLIIQNSNNNVFIASQDVSKNQAGAFTGEVSAEMLSSIDVKYSIIGHSERRLYHNESNKDISQKFDNCTLHHITPILCVGESLAAREKGDTFKVILSQLEDFKLKFKENNIIIAYEPIWAIGTGVTASVEQANEVHDFIYDYLAKTLNIDVANKIPILYGGSCNAQNASDLFKCKNISGGLIGGASLKIENFKELIEIANEVSKNH